MSLLVGFASSWLAAVRCPPASSGWREGRHGEEMSGPLGPSDSSAHTRTVTLDKSLNFSQPLFSQLSMDTVVAACLYHRTFVRVQGASALKDENPMSAQGRQEQAAP